MVIRLLGNKSPDLDRFTLVTPKPENGVRLQATLSNQNPTSLLVGAVSQTTENMAKAVSAKNRHKNNYGLTYDCDKEHCGSVLEISKEDITTRSWSKYFKQISGTDYVTYCPKCNCCLYINPALLPEWVKAEAKQRSKSLATAIANAFDSEN